MTTPVILGITAMGDNMNIQEKEWEELPGKKMLYEIWNG